VKNQSIYFTIGKNLASLRKSKKLKQRELAELLGIERSNYAYYESGGHKIPLDILVKLADYYGVSLDEIVKTNKNLKQREPQPPPHTNS